MRKIIEVVFDGATFVPTGSVGLPAGTKVLVQVPDEAAPEPLPAHGYPGPRAGAPDPLRPPTPEEEAVWVEFLRAVRSAPPDPPTFDEYLRQEREGS